MDKKLCIRCGTRNGGNSPRCWYCHAYVTPELQAAFDGENRLRPVRPKKERTTVVFVVLRMHVVSEPPDDLTPDDDGEIIAVAVDHTRTLLSPTDALPEDKGHKVVLTAIEAADVVDRR